MFIFRTITVLLNWINNKIRIARAKCLYGKRISLDRDCHLARGASLDAFKGGYIKIGSGCWFNKNCSVGAREKIVIGDNCIFGENVKIYDHNHVHIITDENMPFKNQGFTTEPVVIGNNCWVGSNVVIVPGGRLGDDCVVGANTVVYKNIPSGSVVVNGTGLKIMEAKRSKK